MASGRKGRNDITLGAGHIAGIFLGFIVLCGLFFTLGYVMGHGGHPSGLTLHTGRNRGAPEVGSNGNLSGSAGSPPTGWDFFPRNSRSSRGSGNSPVPGLTPETSPRQPSGPIAMPARPKDVRIVRKPPVLANGREGISLQVAALSNRADAISLAGFLKKKGYAAFAWGPAPDRLYKVQVGPFTNVKAAQAVRLRLKNEGFNSILKKAR